MESITVAATACIVIVVAVRAVIGPPSAEGHPFISAQSDDKSNPHYI